MTRTRRTWIAALGALTLASAALVACSGQVSNGKVTSNAQQVSLSAISGEATPCSAGYAHPSVCCDTGPGQAATCVAYPDAPFAQCQGGATTYPDPRSCCPLDGNGACAAPPPVPVDAGTSSGGSSCSYACPVGWYSPPASSSGGTVGDTCCQTNPDGSGTCSGGGSTLGGSSGGSSGTGCTCACPSCDPDSGVCPPCPPCNCPPQPAPTPSCDACPPGWQTPAGEPLLCCATASDGTISCFSQGVPPTPTPTPVDAGAPASCFGGGGGGADGGVFSTCGCSETVGGVDYTVTCNDPPATCTCQASNATTTSSVPQPSSACNDTATLFGACGFPTSGNQGTGGGSPGSSSSSSGG